MDLSEVAKGGDVAGAIPESRRHPWEQARADFVVRVLRDAGLFEEGHAKLTLLDVGAGDGYVARRVAPELPPQSHVTCWDAEYTAAQLTTLSSASPSIVFTASRPSGRFALLLLLDVLEHIEDDGAFLGALVAEVAEPGARVLVTVPAWPQLFGAHDRLLRHERRYTPAACAARLRGAGLTVDREGGLFPTLLPLRAAAIAAERAGLVPGDAATGVSGGFRGGAAMRAVVRSVLRADAAFSRAASRVAPRGGVPGLSYFALCTKR